MQDYKKQIYYIHRLQIGTNSPVFLHRSISTTSMKICRTCKYIQHYWFRKFALLQLANYEDASIEHLIINLILSNLFMMTHWISRRNKTHILASSAVSFYIKSITRLSINQFILRLVDKASWLN